MSDISASTVEIYVCSSGETFDSIALSIYEDEKYACDILNANPNLCRIIRFSGGEQLVLPNIEIPENEEGIPYKAPWKE